MNIKYVAIGAAIGGLIGFSLGYFPIKSSFNEYKLEQQSEMTKLEQTYRDREQQLLIKKDETINYLFKELEQADSIQRSLRATVDKLHNLYSNSIRTSTSDTLCKPYGESIRECKGLLIEGSELLGEGSGLFYKNSVKHDALIKELQ